MNRRSFLWSLALALLPSLGWLKPRAPAPPPISVSVGYIAEEFDYDEATGIRTIRKMRPTGAWAVDWEPGEVLRPGQIIRDRDGELCLVGKVGHSE